MCAKTINKQIEVHQTESVSTFRIGNRILTFSKEEKVGLLLLLLLIIVTAVIRANFLSIPYERDEGAYSYYGKLLLDGKTPYKEFFEQKLPGIFYFYGVMVAIFGSSVKEMHIGFTVLNLLSIIFIYFSAKRLFSPIAGIISATTYAFVSLTPNLSGFTIQAEHGVAFFICIGIYLYVIAREKKKWIWYALMGFALGTAFMVKTSGLFLMFWGGLMLLIDFFFTKEKKNYKTLFINVFSYCAGAIFIIGILLFIVYLKGTFNEMIFWVYDIPKYYVNRIPFEEGVKYFGYSRDVIVQNYKFFWVHGVLAVAIIFIKSISFRLKLFVLSLGALSFLTIVPGYYFYGHYWIQLIPGLAIISGATYFGVMTLLNNRFKFASPTPKYIYLSVFALLTFLHLNKNRAYYFNPNYDLILRQVYGNNPFPETKKIGDYLNSISKPEDQLAVFGSEPELFIYTNKLSPTRHVFFSTIVASIPEHKKFQREFTADIEKARPKYFVFYRHSVSLLVQANTDQYVFDWANKYLNENYKVIGVVDMPDGYLLSNYIFGKEAETYQAKGQNVIFIFERKS